MHKAEEMVDVWSEEFGAPFHGCRFAEEGLLTPVLTVLKDEVTSVGHGERPLYVGQRQV